MNSGISAEEDKKNIEKLIIETNEYENILSNALKPNELSIWESLEVNESYPIFSYDASFPDKSDYLKTGVMSGFMNKLMSGKIEEKYNDACLEYKIEKQRLLKEYIYNKVQFEKDKTERNVEADFLKYHYKNGEKTAVEKYADTVISCSQYPESLKIRYKTYYTRTEKKLTVNFLLPELNDLLTDRGILINNKDVLTETILKKIEKNFYERTLISIGIRTMYELFEAISSELVRKIAFNGYVPTNESAWENIDFSGHMRCIFSMESTREKFSDINLYTEEPLKIAESLNLLRVKNFSDPMQLIAPIKVQ
ncbi:MAG TPA: hypothetical protein PKI60_03615 [Oscillospiraceae bacterium]|nr:hypothetical protein [Oscillospiraceae bacterium]